MDAMHDFLLREQVGRAKQILDEMLLLLDIDLPDDGTDETHAAAEIRAALKLVTVEIADKTKAIETDRDLSNAGRAKRFVTLASSMRPRLQGLERAIMPKLAVKLDALRTELTAPLPALRKDDSAGAIRQWEVRSRLDAMDEGARLSALWRAVELGDAETLSAFIFAPKSFPLVDGEVLAQAMDAHWRRQRPDLMEQIESTETLAEMLATNFRSLAHVLDNLSGIIAGDPAESVNAVAGNE